MIYSSVCSAFEPFLGRCGRSQDLYHRGLECLGLFEIYNGPWRRWEDSTGPITYAPILGTITKSSRLDSGSGKTVAGGSCLGCTIFTSPEDVCDYISYSANFSASFVSVEIQVFTGLQLVCGK